MPFPPGGSVASFGDLDLPDMYTETKSPFITLKADSQQRLNPILKLETWREAKWTNFLRLLREKFPSIKGSAISCVNSTAGQFHFGLLSWRWEQKPATSGLQTLLGDHFPASGRHRGTLSGRNQTAGSFLIDPFLSFPSSPPAPPSSSSPSLRPLSICLSTSLLPAC